MAFPCGMDQALSFLRCHPDRDIFDGSAHSRHRVAFEMREDQISIIFREMSSYQVFGQLRPAFHRKGHRAILVQHNKIRNLCKTMVFCHLIVHSGGRSLASVSSIVLHNRSVHQTDQVGDESRVQIIAGRRFARRQFHGYVFAGEAVP